MRLMAIYFNLPLQYKNSNISCKSFFKEIRYNRIFVISTVNDFFTTVRSSNILNIFALELVECTFDFDTICTNDN